MLWLFTVTFDDTKPPPKAVNCNMNSLSRLHGKMRPWLTGLPYLADRATRLGGLPNLSCKHDQIQIRDYMERRVTPPRRVTSPTWGPPPPCKQALRSTVEGIMCHVKKDVRVAKDVSIPQGNSSADLFPRKYSSNKNTVVY